MSTVFINTNFFNSFINTNKKLILMIIFNLNKSINLFHTLNNLIINQDALVALKFLIVFLRDKLIICMTKNKQ